jgi:ribosome-associated toxin RatA of RatAB toxin-antitoxin module
LGFVPQACRIDLKLDFALRNTEHVMMWDMMKDRVVAEYLNCFQRRCAQLKAKSVQLV